MAACRRITTAWTLLRSCGQRGLPGFRRSPSAAVCEDVSSSVWRHTWGAEAALSQSPARNWTSPRRSLRSEEPYNNDGYPPLQEYCSLEKNTKEVFMIHVKGLLWSCSAEDLMVFFSDCQIHGGITGIHLLRNKNNKPNGQALIELVDEQDIIKALEKHRQYLGPRYIEVNEIEKHHAEVILNSKENRPCEDGVVRIRGIPFNCTEDDVRNFFSGLDVVEDGVTFVRDWRGRISNDAYVQFANQEMADQALQRDREFIGNRYIQVFPCKKSEIQTQCGRGKGEFSGTAFHTQWVNEIEKHNAEVILNSKENRPCEDGVVRIRGIPFNCTEDDVRNFFSGLDVVEDGVTFVRDWRGRISNDAYVQFANQEMADQALQRDREFIGNRYIQVFPCKKSEIQTQCGRGKGEFSGTAFHTQWVNEIEKHNAEVILNSKENRPCEDGVVRIRGIPFNCTEDDVRNFFSGLDVVEDGVTFVRDWRGRISNDAYVQFANQEMADQALQRDREFIGNRYIQVFPCKKSEIQTQCGRGKGEFSGTAFHTQWANSLHHILMKGIPYQATAEDIINFFSPIRVEKVLIEYGPNGQALGKAYACFVSHEDAVAAMSKDNKYIDNRFINLYLKSPSIAEGE